MSSQDQYKTLIRLLKFGRILRQYVLVYFAIEQAIEEQITNAALQSDGSSDSFNLPEMSCQLVEQLVKKKSSYRNIADSEKKFMNFVLLLVNETSKI